jgi:tetratricopeptide (TPR) repeat protein
VHYYLGTVYTELSENDRAIAEFDKIPGDNEHYVESRLQLAYLYDKQNKYDQALGALKDALAKKPNDPEIIGFMVGVYQEKKDYPAAIELARKMVAADPKSDKFHFTLGAALDQNKQRDEGMAEMKKAIELNPANAQALNYLGYSYAEQGTNLVEAEKLIKRALDIEPEDGFYVDSLGWVYYQKGDYKQAVEQLERAVNLTGSDPTITEHLGDAYRKLGKTREAGHEYTDALKKAQETDQVARLKDKIQVLQNAASAGH